MHTPCWTGSTFPILFGKWWSAVTVCFSPDTLDFWLFVFKKRKRSVCTKLSWQNMHRKLCSCKIVVWYAWCRFHLKCFSFIIKIYFTCSTVFTCYYFPPSLFIFVSCRLHFKIATTNIIKKSPAVILLLLRTQRVYVYYIKMNNDGGKE